MARAKQEPITESYYYQKHYHHGGIVHHYKTRKGRYQNHRFAHHALGQRWQDRHKRWSKSHIGWRYKRFQRRWWHGRWWGPGWSTIPAEWLENPEALRLRLANYAHKGDWDEIYYIVNREIDHIQATAARIHTPSYPNSERLRTLQDKRDLLESFIQDADVYRSTPIQHSELQQYNKYNNDEYSSVNLKERV
jgi:hypothetical protein